ncbi:DUF6603 domain-containing protein [Streptomyces sp. I05A-00742]|uniref:DUF6603 domain-containing protein n=1 Tax=Streptomyces sp. I05A-00742 TaxID=2732853 RepID=UPI002896D5BA|nr:DUF6603 domain-containing protein [Streptomyces sp. I05A-00742]
MTQAERERTTLLQILEEMDLRGLELPEELVPFLENVHRHEGLPGKDKLITGQFPGYTDEPGDPNPVDGVFVSTTRLGGDTLTAFVLSVRVGFDGSTLPLVGDGIPEGALTFPLLRVIYVSRPLDMTATDRLTALLAEYGLAERVFPRPNAMSDNVWAKGFTGVLTWKVNGGEMPALAVRVEKEKEDEPPEPDKEIRVPGLPVSYGPLEIAALMRGRDKKYLRIYFTGELRIAGSVFALDGLGLTIPLKLGRIPQPRLAGASLALRRSAPPMAIDAALRWTDSKDEAVAGGLLGLVRVSTPMVEVMGAGGFARASTGYSTVFLYVEALLAEGRSLFGPPPFTVTGVSGGFGLNSRVIPPSATQLPEFPLIGRLNDAPTTPGEPAPQPPEPMDMLDRLAGRAGWVRPEEGSYWAAVGVRFTSFRFIETQALALVEFGNRLNLMLLGRTSLSLPKTVVPGRKEHARLNIDLRLAFLSEQHLLALDVAVGAGSYIFDPACTLSGGLAVYIWTGGDRGGDFVISLGGYHPQFPLPPHYPRPARLGLEWNPCSRVSVRASGYTALTPGAVMFGGALAARYEKGLLSAWFTAHLDALIQWKPFYLDIALGISIGVAFTIKVWFVKVRVSIEVGIDLQLWTPPMGGRVSVRVWFVSFSFDFGSSRAGAPPVPWGEFQMQLPAPVRTKTEKGLLLDADSSEREARAAADAPLLVSPDGFAFSTESALPASEVRINDKTYATADTIDIRPMRKSGVTSRHLVRIRKGGLDFDAVDNGWSITVQRRGLPRSLWGSPLADPAEAAREEGLIPGMITGLHFEVPKPELGVGLGPVSSRSLGFDPLPDGATPLRDAAPAGPAPCPGDDRTVELITTTLAAQETVIRRTAVFAALGRLDAEPAKNADSPLTAYADLAGRTMTNAPMTADAA